MAFDKHTGEERWRALQPRTEMGYSQTVIIEAGGARQLIVWHPWGTLVARFRRPARCIGKNRSPRGQAPIADPCPQ